MSVPQSLGQAPDRGRRRSLCGGLGWGLGLGARPAPGSAARWAALLGATGAGALPAMAARPGRLPPLEPLRLRERRLANGLQVVAAPDPTGAMASVQVWYRVGAKDDPEGRSGFAHLFEHLMFKRTRWLPDEAFDRLTEDVGGQNNAFTAEDVTVYQSEVPPNHVERLIWAEAERMAHLQVDQANFASERRVVLEELRERVLSEPYGRLFDAFAGAAFVQHPYRRPVIGNEHDLMAATLDDVRRFHATYYRPDNAVLVVVGDVSPRQLDLWVDRHFGPLVAPPAPIPRVRLVEPARVRPMPRTLRAPQVPLPAVALVWRGPAAASADAPALAVAQALLAGGESSRLSEALVLRERQAQVAGFEASLFADAGLLAAYAIAAAGQSLQGLADALMAQIRRLAQAPIPEAEMRRVQARLLTQALVQRQTPQGRAEALGQAALLHGRASAADEALSRLHAVRAADVQRVLRRFVVSVPPAVLHYRQGA